MATLVRTTDPQTGKSCLAGAAVHGRLNGWHTVVAQFECLDPNCEPHARPMKVAGPFRTMAEAEAWIEEHRP